VADPERRLERCHYRPALGRSHRVPLQGATEVWEFRNTQPVMHPMHIHLVEFQVLNRQAIDAAGNPTGPIIAPDPLRPMPGRTR